jgi:hypothetical protein
MQSPAPAPSHPRRSARRSTIGRSLSGVATLLIGAISLALLLSGCTPNRTPANPMPANAAISGTALADPGTDLSPTEPNLSWLIEPPASTAGSELNIRPRTGEPLPLLRQLALAPAPTGSGPLIALRFLRALQRHDDLAAGHELYSLTRLLISDRRDRFLTTLMDDVRTHAALDTAGPCTHARSLNDESAVVTCGHTKVVVHVLSGFARGVQLADWRTHRDVYPGRHTHAYTTLQP